MSMHLLVQLLDLLRLVHDLRGEHLAELRQLTHGALDAARALVQAGEFADQGPVLLLQCLLLLRRQVRKGLALLTGLQLRPISAIALHVPEDSTQLLVAPPFRAA